MSQVSGRSFVKFAAVIASIATPCSALAGLITESFNSGPGRFTTQLRANTAGNSIGFSNTDNTGTSGGGSGAGEMGGTFARTPSPTPGYVADGNIGTLTPSDNLSLSGHFIVTAQNSFNGNIFVGYIRTDNDNPYSGNGNGGLTGFSILDGSPLRARMWSRGSAFGGATQSGILLNTPYTYNLTYDPGTGMMGGTIGPLTFAAAATGLQPTDTFNGFAIMAGGAGDSQPTQTANTFFDDVTYNIAAVPEPGSALLLGPAAACLLAKRRRRQNSCA